MLLWHLLAPVVLQAAVVDDRKLSQSAQDEIVDLMKEKASWTTAQCKLDSHLIHAMKLKQGKAFAPKATHLRVEVKEQADGRVLVDITATVTPEVLALVKSGGGEVINNFPKFNAIRALVTLTNLETLAASPDVKFIQAGEETHFNTGSVISQGDITHNAAVARNKFGVTGAGVKVGVISDSVNYLTNSQASGDLGVVTVLSGQSGTGLGEGTAMLEIIHDLAPGADLYFATSGTDTAAHFAQNILNLRAAGCDIIVDDAYRVDEPVFQDGVIAQAVNTVTTNGALYFSAAGNLGNVDSGTSGTWEGDFVDGGAAASPIPESGRLHNFGSANYNHLLFAPPAHTHKVALFWSDPWGASTNDYDLFDLDTNGLSVYDYSTTRQTGTQNPYEILNAVYDSDRIVIVKYSGESRFLHLDTFGARLETATAGGSKGHLAAKNTITVGAVDAGLAYPGAFSINSAITVENFSADGSRRIFFNPDGSAITPGNFSSTGGAVLQKPDLAAADYVATSVPGFQSFYGSSAAAPHAAAIAALLKSSKPNLSASEIRALLSSTALDIGVPGWDRNSGYGIVMADSALQGAPADTLLILPGIGMAASGPVGGPFSLTSQNFSLTNDGPAAFNWTLSNTSLWLNVSPTSGTLVSNGPATVLTVSLNSASSNLAAGVYSIGLNFSNLVSGLTQTRQITFSVSAPASASYVSNVLALKPAAYWRLNETTPTSPVIVSTNIGASAPAGNGACNGVLAGRTGMVGTSYQFFNPHLDKYCLGSSVDIPYQPVFNPTGPFTIEFWAQRAQTVAATTFSPSAVSCVNSPNNDIHHCAGWYIQENYLYSKDVWEFYVAANTSDFYFCRATNSNGFGWCHVAGVYDGTNIFFYVNGQGISTQLATPGWLSPNTNAPLRLGGSTFGQLIDGASKIGDRNNGFDGYLDQVAIYTNALNSNTIAAHYAAATTNNAGYSGQILADHPIGYWRLNEIQPGQGALPLAVNTGGTAPAGNGVYEPGLTPGVAGVAYGGFGANNFACQFNGQNYIDCGSSFFNFTGPLTLSAWIKANPANGVSQSIISKGNASYYLAMDNNGYPCFTAGVQKAGVLSGASRIDDGQWHHLVGVFDGASSEFLYVDALLRTNINTATNPIAGNANNLLIGAFPLLDFQGKPCVNESISGRSYFTTNYWSGFNGTIDEVVIWTNALSAAQIQQLYFTATNSVIQTAPVFQPLTRLGNTLFLNWSAISGRSYQVQYKTNLTQSSWGTLTTLTATNGTASFTDDMTADRQRFYRAVLMP
ncbi:MAG: LamG-like jellyroll fold domain-containing protein [Verrucomicrobiota bacterium]